MNVTARQLQLFCAKLKSDRVDPKLVNSMVALVLQQKQHELLQKDSTLQYDNTPYPDGPRTVNVEVCRVGYGSLTMEVPDARSDREAAEVALNKAGGESFSEHSSEYTAEGVG